MLACGPWRCKACVAELGVFTGPDSESTFDVRFDVLRSAVSVQASVAAWTPVRVSRLALSISLSLSEAVWTPVRVSRISLSLSSMKRLSDGEETHMRKRQKAHVNETKP